MQFSSSFVGYCGPKSRGWMVTTVFNTSSPRVPTTPVAGRVAIGMGFTPRGGTPIVTVTCTNGGVEREEWNCLHGLSSVLRLPAAACGVRRPNSGREYLTTAELMETTPSPLQQVVVVGPHFDRVVRVLTRLPNITRGGYLCDLPTTNHLTGSLCKGWIGHDIHFLSLCWLRTSNVCLYMRNIIKLFIIISVR